MTSARVTLGFQINTSQLKIFYTLLQCCLVLLKLHTLLSFRGDFFLYLLSQRFGTAHSADCRLGNVFLMRELGLEVQNFAIRPRGVTVCRRPSLGEVIKSLDCLLQPGF